MTGVQTCALPICRQGRTEWARRGSVHTWSLGAECPCWGESWDGCPLATLGPPWAAHAWRCKQVWFALSPAAWRPGIWPPECSLPGPCSGTLVTPPQDPCPWGLSLPPPAGDLRHSLINPVSQSDTWTPWASQRPHLRPSWKVHRPPVSIPCLRAASRKVEGGPLTGRGQVL